MSKYRENVATNACGENQCSSFVATANSGLSCTPYGNFRLGGWPVAGGRILIQFWSAPCPPATQPSLNPCFQAPLQLPWCAPDPPIGQNYDTKTFTTRYGFFGATASQQGTSPQFRWFAKITNATQTNLTVQLTIEWLNEIFGANVWQNWYSSTLTLPITAPYQRNSGNGFKSNPEYIPFTPNGLNCNVKYISVIAGLEPIRLGCGTGENDYSCSLYDGTNYITCARGLLEYKNGTDLPVPFLMGLNGSTCTTTSSCGCDECFRTATNYTCLFNSDATFGQYVVTNFNEPVDAVQQIQVGSLTPFPIMIKIVNGTRYVYWAPSFPTWERQAFNVIQVDSPTIVVAEDANYKITIYYTEFPSESLLPICPITEEAPPPPPVSTILTRTERLATRANGGCGCGRPLKNNWHPEPKKET